MLRTSISFKKPLTAVNIEITCSSICKGEYSGCFNNSVSLSPLSSKSFVDESKSDANWEKACISLYWAKSSFIVPATFFIASIWAADPTLLTDNPILIAGLIPL